MRKINNLIAQRVDEMLYIHFKFPSFCAHCLSASEAYFRCSTVDGVAWASIFMCK